MKENDTIICWGCDKQQEQILYDCLPDKKIKIIVINDKYDLLDIKFFMAIINPEGLSNDELAFCVNFFKNERLDIPVLIKPCSFLDENKVKYIFLQDCSAITYTIMDYRRNRKKTIDFYNGITESLLILRAIKENPGVSTKKLAGIIEKSDRTALRYINSLICAGEMIEYDPKKKGWYFSLGYSELTDTAGHKQYSLGQIKSNPIFDVVKKTKLKRNYWDWDAWYGNSLKFFREVFEYAEGDEPFFFLWYSIAEIVVKHITGREKSIYCFEVFNDLMMRLHGRNEYYESIMMDVLDYNERYLELINKYRFSEDYDKGFYWIEYHNNLSSEEYHDLEDRMLLYNDWREAYTERYVECWLAKKKVSGIFNSRSISKEYESMEIIANFMYEHKDFNLDELITEMIDIFEYDHETMNIGKLIRKLLSLVNLEG